ncbi:MAG: response regulator [Hirschia sp.]|mgnify:CR=1 FL=1|nr:response regulator [Hirschia sp.]MBF18111.1 response regulator [Hirschia sp.]
MPETSPKTLSISACRNLRVLIVDPNAYMRGIVADALRRMQISSMSSCGSTDEAYEACHTFKPDFVITDWEAGKMSGLDFTRSIRRGERNLRRAVPIILLADQVNGEQLAMARQAGINEFLLKPVSVHTLRSRIEEVLLRPRKFIDSRNYVGPCRRRRDDPDYGGPARRLTDEVENRSPAEVNPERINKLRRVVNQLTGFAARDDSDYRNIVRGLYKLLSSNQEGIDALGDDVISRIWRSAIRYIEGIGMSPNYSPDVIMRHFEAVAAIMDMPQESFNHRQALANDLEKLVSKRIHAFELDLGDQPKKSA